MLLLKKSYDDTARQIAVVEGVDALIEYPSLQ